VNPTQGGWLILLTLLAGLILAVLHLPTGWPDWLGWLRPAWMALIVFFWVLELPHRLGLISAWLTGLALDVLRADPLGLNGFLLAGITYVTWRFYERLRMYSVAQQGGVVFLLVLVTELIRLLALKITLDRALHWGPLAPALVSMVLWPFVYLLLQRLRVQARVE